MPATPGPNRLSTFRRSARRRSGPKLLVVIALIATTLFAPQTDSAAQQVVGSADAIVIEKVVVGAAAPDDFSFVVEPEVEGCSASQTVNVAGAGGTVEASVRDGVAGPMAFDQDDFVVTPVFGDVRSFGFFLDVEGIAAAEAYVNPPFDVIDYGVSGSLDGTPSGFPAFRLERTILFTDFVNQGSQITFTTAANATLADGLQISDLAGTDAVFVLDALELGTGRYHPPTLELRADGTGRIQNSANAGGINPQTNEEVNVDFGEEYITDLSFDPTSLTLADGTPCTYTVTEQLKPGYTATTAVFRGVAPGETVTFENTEIPPVCQGRIVTIDMRINGGNGIGTFQDDVILGTSGPDFIDSGPGDDVICAGDGDDVIRAGVGDDVVHAGGGNDKVFGSQGNDRLRGGPGDDTIHGNRGEDFILGEDGNDRLFGYADDDFMRGGPGNDRMHGNDGRDEMGGGDGDDVVFGYADNDFIDGGEGNDLLSGNFGDDRLSGNGGDDVVFGADGNDTVFGGDGNDELHGNSLNDRLNGGFGDDSVDGGIGFDVCDGGLSGLDTFSRCESLERVV